MDIIDIERQAKHQFFSAQKTPPAPLPVVIHTVDLDGDYAIIDYTGTDGARDKRAVPYVGCPNSDPLNLDNEQFYINAILGV